MYPTVQRGLAQSRVLPRSGRGHFRWRDFRVPGGTSTSNCPGQILSHFLSLSPLRPLSPAPPPRKVWDNLSPRKTSRPQGANPEKSRNFFSQFLTQFVLLGPPPGTAALGTSGASDGGGGGCRPRRLYLAAARTQHNLEPSAGPSLPLPQGCSAVHELKHLWAWTRPSQHPSVCKLDLTSGPSARSVPSLTFDSSFAKMPTGSSLDGNSCK